LSAEERAGPASLQPAEPHVLQVGVQSVPLPPSLTAQLLQSPAASLRGLAGTRVWMERRQSRLVLHLGDVERDTGNGG